MILHTEIRLIEKEVLGVDKKRQQAVYLREYNRAKESCRAALGSKFDCSDEEFGEWYYHSEDIMQFSFEWDKRPDDSVRATSIIKITPPRS